MMIRSAFASPKSGPKQQFGARGPRSTGIVSCGPRRDAAMIVVAADNAVNARPLLTRLSNGEIGE
jgi:hypothetical protein